LKFLVFGEQRLSGNAVALLAVAATDRFRQHLTYAALWTNVSVADAVDGSCTHRRRDAP
jgi:hypothetical protein